MKTDTTQIVYLRRCLSEANNELAAALVDDKDVRAVMRRVLQRCEVVEAELRHLARSVGGKQ